MKLCVNRNASRQGFTLIEMIGVLAIVAILAAAIIPAIVRRLDIAARNKEMSDLAAIGNALTLQSLRSDALPSPSTWALTVATWAMRPQSQITLNSRNFTRYFLVDPNFSLPGASGLPYSQSGNQGLTNQPSFVRALIVSTIGSANAQTNPPAFFNDTWNWDTALNPTAKPASWSGFPGNGDDVCIQRLNLQPMFHRLILVNRDATNYGNNASFSINAINSAAAQIVANGSPPWDNYYLDGSAVSLYSTNNLQTTYVLKGDASFVYENGAWNSQIMDGLTGANPAPTNSSAYLSAAFAASAANFMYSSWNPEAADDGSGYSGNSFGGGSSQSALLAAFNNFMLDYSMWSDSMWGGGQTPFNEPGSIQSQYNANYVLLQNDVNNILWLSGVSQAGMLNEDQN